MRARLQSKGERVILERNAPYLRYVCGEGAPDRDVSNQKQAFQPLLANSRKEKKQSPRKGHALGYDNV